LDQELYANLLIRYSNRSYWKDDNGLKGIILFNEKPSEIKRLWVKYKYSKFGYSETIDIELVKRNGVRIPLKKDIYKIDIIEFVKFALTRGYDWRLYGEPEWKAIEPKKTKKFMKPKKR